MKPSKSDEQETSIYGLLRKMTRDQIVAMKRVADSSSLEEFREFLAIGSQPTNLAMSDLGCFGPGPTTFNPDAEGPADVPMPAG